MCFAFLLVTSMLWHLIPVDVSVYKLKIYSVIGCSWQSCNNFLLLVLQVYTWGKGYCGALGHGDEIDKTTPELLNNIKTRLAVQVCFVQLFYYFSWKFNFNAKCWWFLKQIHKSFSSPFCFSQFCETLTSNPKTIL